VGFFWTAFPSDRTPRYLLLDRDSIFSTEITAAIKSFGIDPARSAYRSPWQNGLRRTVGRDLPARASRSRDRLQ
jgi:hypothetical protein